MRTLSTFSKAMAQVMKSRMAFHGISQSEMANAINISQSQLSKILRADRSIDLDTFAAFCESIGESPTELIKEGEQFAEKIKTEKPNLYMHAANEHLVSLATTLAATHTSTNNSDERNSNQNNFDYTAYTEEAAKRDDYRMAAYRDPNKYIESQTPAD